MFQLNCKIFWYRTFHILTGSWKGYQWTPELEKKCYSKKHVVWKNWQLEGDAVRSWITGLWQRSYANLDLFCLKPVCSFNIPSPAVLTLGIHFSFLLAFRISQFYFKFELLLIFFWSRLLFFFSLPWQFITPLRVGT